MHFVNMTDVMMVVFNMFQQFQKEKMKQRNKIHKRVKYNFRLHNYFSVAVST